MRIHTDGEFKCEVCHKSFDRKDTYNDHVRNHTGEKPFKCRFCPKSFSRSFVLTKHEKNHALKKSKYDEYEGQTKTIYVDEGLEYDDGDGTTEILLPKDFTSGVVIEEPTVELIEQGTLTLYFYIEATARAAIPLYFGLIYKDFFLAQLWKDQRVYCIIYFIK